MAEDGFTIEIKKPEALVLLLVLTAIFVLEFRVSYSSPIVFGDEGLHTRTAQWIAEEREYPVWYPFFETNTFKWGFVRPPLFNILEGSLLLLSGSSEFIIKFFTPFVASILTGLAIFLLVKRIYNKEVAFLAAVIAVTIPSLVTYSVLFYTDTLFTFYFILFVLCFILAIENDSRKYFALTGVFGALSFLTKTPGVVVFIIAGAGLLYQMYKERNSNTLKNYAILGSLLILVLSGFSLRSYYYYGTPNCNLPLPFFDYKCSVDSRESDALAYEGVAEQIGTEMSVPRIGAMNYLDFAYGNVWFVMFAFIGGLIVAAYRKSRSDILVLLSLVPIIIVLQRYFFGRAEDTARYTLGWVPIIALIAGNYFEQLYDFIKKKQKYVALLVFVLVLYFGFVNLQGKLDIMRQVKQFSPAFFEACNWVRQNVPEDATIMTIFGSATSYNCQRTVGGGGPDVSLSGNLSLSLSHLERDGTTHIFIQKFALSNKALSEKYQMTFVNMLENNPQNFEKIYESGEKNLAACADAGCDGAIIYKINYNV